MNKKKTIFIISIIIGISALITLGILAVKYYNNIINSDNKNTNENNQEIEKMDTYIYDKNGNELDIIKYGDVSYFDNVKSYYMASALENILNDIIEKENVTEAEAEIILVTNGYKIYLCEDYNEQEKLEQIYENDENFLDDLDAATIVLDNSTGEVSAIIGGRNKYSNIITFGEDKKALGNIAIKNMATAALFQPTHMLPIISVYACGLEKGIITLDSIYSDDSLEVNLNWKPQNYYNYSQGDITIKKAIETGSNLVKIRVLQDIGIETSYEFIKSIGITGLREEYDKNLPALALGGTTQGVKPIEISSAYRTILTDGIYKTPIFYNKVIDSSGEVYLKNEQNENYVVKEEVCKKLKSCLNTTIHEKDVYIKEAKHQQNLEHWCNITTDKYTYTTICYHSKSSFKEINSKENTAKELLTKIIN